jgi:GT2 family glycosyltransferase
VSYSSSYAWLSHRTLREEQTLPKLKDYLPNQIPTVYCRSLDFLIFLILYLKLYLGKARKIFTRRGSHDRMSDFSVRYKCMKPCMRSIVRVVITENEQNLKMQHKIR